VAEVSQETAGSACRWASLRPVDRDTLFRTLLLLHVLGAIASLGPSLTYGLWIGLAERADPRNRAFVLGSISRIDRRLTTPSYMAQAVTGVALILVRRWDFFGTPWLVTAVALYVALTVVAVVAYAPAFRRQSALAARVAEGDQAAEADYREASRRARTFGIVTTVLTLAVVVLMVTKPALWD
jgi:uncharacterized membrane protein